MTMVGGWELVRCRRKEQGVEDTHSCAHNGALNDTVILDAS